MKKEYKNAIWEGRFQPVHIGHLAYIKELLIYADHIWLVVLENNKSTNEEFNGKNLPVPEFSKTVDEHHGIEKNPLPLWVRYETVKKTVISEFGVEVPITVLWGRRLDLDWDFYRRNFPAERVFLTPTRDSYEDVKAAAWEKLGEKCVRIDVDHLPKISASAVREVMQQGKEDTDLLHPETIKTLKELGYYENLKK
jgi:hypothetical protein